MSTSSPSSVLASTTLSAVRKETSDAAGGTSTTYKLNLHDVVTGEISGSSDSDWYKVILTAGKTYVFSVWGTGGSNSALKDSELSLYGASRGLLASDNSYSSNAVITYTAQTSGVYYLAVDGASASDSGDYRLQVSTDVFTVNEVARYITEFGWGDNTTLSFSQSSIPVNLGSMTAAQKVLALAAFEAWSMATGLSFTFTTSASADITFVNSGSGSYATLTYYPTTGEIVSSTVTIPTSWVASYGISYDSFSFQTYLHEIGHALGLSHPGGYDGSAVYGVDNIFVNDSNLLTVMSYFQTSENSSLGLGGSTVITPMIADYAAMRLLYGAVSAYAGNTVWGAQSNVGGYLGTIFSYIFDGKTADSSLYSGGRVAFTVYDTGGYDVLNFSGVSAAQKIDMRVGQISTVGEKGHVMGIAQGTLIEAAYGGAGADTIIGNLGSNRIGGGAGNDSLYGNAGADTLLGGAGNDVLKGNLGHDRLQGGIGKDVLYGELGNDVLYGQQGMDRLFGGVGADRLFGGNANDRLWGGTGNDLLKGDSGNDTLWGGGGNDRLFGGAGADRLLGSLGKDQLWGGAGNDRLFGENGNDSLYGGLGNDILWGGSGSDVLQGGAGKDFLDAGAGSDRLTGGIGADIFSFSIYKAGQQDVITDFQDGTDRLYMSDVQGGYSALSISLAEGSQSGVLIEYEGQKILLAGIGRGLIGVEDFIFV